MEHPTQKIKILVFLTAQNLKQQMKSNKFGYIAIIVRKEFRHATQAHSDPMLVACCHLNARKTSEVGGIDINKVFPYDIQA